MVYLFAINTCKCECLFFKRYPPAKVLATFFWAFGDIAYLMLWCAGKYGFVVVIIIKTSHLISAFNLLLWNVCFGKENEDVITPLRCWSHVPWSVIGGFSSYETSNADMPFMVFLHHVFVEIIAAEPSFITHWDRVTHINVIKQGHNWFR